VGRRRCGPARCGQRSAGRAVLRAAGPGLIRTIRTGPRAEPRATSPAP
jgi:hypothetical protein